MQIVVNCETRLCSQFLGPGDNFLQSYGAIFTDRAATGSGNLMDLMSTPPRIAIRGGVLFLDFSRSVFPSMSTQIGLTCLGGGLPRMF